MRTVNADEEAENPSLIGGEAGFFLELNFFVSFFKSLVVEVGDAVAVDFFEEEDPTKVFFDLPTRLPSSWSFCRELRIAFALKLENIDRIDPGIGPACCVGRLSVVLRCRSLGFFTDDRFDPSSKVPLSSCGTELSIAGTAR